MKRLLSETTISWITWNYRYRFRSTSYDNVVTVLYPNFRLLVLHSWVAGRKAGFNDSAQDFAFVHLLRHALELIPWRWFNTSSVEDVPRIEIFSKVNLVHLNLTAAKRLTLSSPFPFVVCCIDVLFEVVVLEAAGHLLSLFNLDSPSEDRLRGTMFELLVLKAAGNSLSFFDFDSPFMHRRASEPQNGLFVNVAAFGRMMFSSCKVEVTQCDAHKHDSHDGTPSGQL